LYKKFDSIADLEINLFMRKGFIRNYLSDNEDAWWRED
jgi:hypothetical protein